MYELHYFDGFGGRAELTRLLFAYGGIAYEQVNIPLSDWPNQKPKYPNGQVPVLKFDGHVLPQSIAIARFAARKTNLLGNDDWEKAQADAFVDTVGEIGDDMRSKGIHLKFREGKAAEIADSLTEALKPHLAKIEKHLEGTNGVNLVGDHLTWADIAVADIFKRYSITATTVLDSPHVKQLVEHVHNLPGIKEHVAKRVLKFAM